MNSRFFQASFRLLLVTVAVAGFITFGGKHRAQKQGARTESSMRYDSEGRLVTAETDYDAQNRIVEVRELKGGKIRKRTHFTYPNGFKEPNTSTTEYHPDGTTARSITNSDVDKNGNPTSSVTTNYDEKGKETGGSKRERDPKTGQEQCYNWNPSKQVYEEVDCPKKPWVSSVDTDNAKLETGAGLIKVNFNVEGGRVIVNLPNDMRAGDTISGTIMEEPNHKNSIDDNAFFVRQLYLDFLGRRPEPGERQFWISTVGEKGTAHFPIKFTVEFPGNQPIPIILRDKDGNPIGSITLPLIPAPPPAAGSNSTSPSSFRIPTLGQQGRPVEITGPFDGDSSNTFLKAQEEIQKVLEKPPDIDPAGTRKNFEDQFSNENFMKGLTPIAESPRQAVFIAPTNVTGPIEITLKERDRETKGTFRTVSVNLSAPKTNLLKGESTTLKIEVQGLQGITQPIPLHLTNSGPVTMQGGISQTMSIKPSDVRADGTYNVVRTITGNRAGGWSATATVVTFNTCLEDDADPLRVLLFNIATGDFVFCQGGDDRTAQNPVSFSTFQFLNDFSTGVRIPAGEAIDVRPEPGAVSIGRGESVKKNGTITMADFNFTGGRIQAQLDWSTHTGGATVQLTNSKQRFTIQDRDTGNNTCTCR